MHCGILFKCPPICQVVEIELITPQRLHTHFFEKEGIKEGNSRPGRMDMAQRSQPQQHVDQVVQL